MYYKLFKKQKIVRILFKDPYWSLGAVLKSPDSKYYLFVGKNYWIVLSVVFIIFTQTRCFQPPCPTYDHRFKSEFIFKLHQKKQLKRKVICPSNDQGKIPVRDYYIHGDSLRYTDRVLYVPKGSDVLTSTGK